MAMLNNQMVNGVLMEKTSMNAGCFIANFDETRGYLGTKILLWIPETPMAWLINCGNKRSELASGVKRGLLENHHL